MTTPTYKIEYRCDDGSFEFWGEVQAATEQEAVAEATRQEPVCIEGRPLKYRATVIANVSDIGITIGADWGCDHLEAEGHAYAAFVERWFSARGLRVSASYDKRHAGRDVIDTDRYTQDDVRAMLGQCWETWCAASWPTTTKEQHAAAKR